MLQLVEHPRAAKYRRYLASIDVVVIILLVVGVVERLQGSQWFNQPLYQESNPEGLQMLLICFCLVLSLVLQKISSIIASADIVSSSLHFIGGAALAFTAMENWVRIQKLSPEEYNDYRQGNRPLHPPPTYTA